MNLSSLVQLPEAKQLVIDAGWPLFEVRKTKLFDNTQRDFGYWDCRAWDDVDPGTLRATYRWRWFDNDNAYIEYFPNKKGLCTAFIPDDPIWHNRIMMACAISEGKFSIQRYHTKDGTVPANVATTYITVIRNYIFEWKVILKETGECVFRSKKADECNAFADATEDPTEVELGKLKPIEGFIKQLGPRWMSSPEWIANYKPALVDLIDKATSPMESSVATIGQNLIQQVGNLSQEDRQKVAAMLMGDAPVNIPAPAAPAQPLGAKTLTSESVALEDKPWTEIRRIASAKGIALTRGMKQPDVIAAIKAKVIADQEAPDSLDGIPEPQPVTADLLNAGDEPFGEDFDSEVTEETIAQ